MRGHDINPHSKYRGDLLIKESWNGITLWDVIEHMERPDQFVSSLDAKYLFLVTPDVENANEDITSWKHYRPDEHQHYFSIRSMDRMLTRSGYTTQMIDRDEARIRDCTSPLNLMTIVAKKNDP